MAFQTASGSPRERWIKALLPTAAILLVYVVFVYHGNNQELTDLRTDLKKVSDEAPSDADILTARFKVDDARAKRDKLQDQVEEAQAEIDLSLARFTGGSPTARVLQLDRLCRELSIAVVRQTLTTEVNFSVSRRKSLDTLRKLADQEITFRQLDVVAHYGDIVTLLRKLPESVEGAVPVGIELLDQHRQGTPAVEASDMRIWRLYVLM